MADWKGILDRIPFGSFTVLTTIHIRSLLTEKHGGAWSFGERLRCHLAWRVDHGTDFSARELADARERTVCDIGCGRGDALATLRNAGFDVTGIEPDPVARSLAVKFARVFDGTAESIQTQIMGQTFDIVLLSHVLEHCIDPHMAIRNVCSIMKPGGLVVIEVPNNEAKGFATFGANWPWSDIPRHINFFTQQSLSALLQTHGLKIAQLRHVGYTRQFAPHWIKTKNEIWDVIGTGSHPNFELAAWILLAQTAFAHPRRKYDSVQIHASKRDSIKNLLQGRNCDS